MYLKLSYSFYHNLILFSQKNYKKQAEMFYQNHSLTYFAIELKKALDLRFKNLELLY